MIELAPHHKVGLALARPTMIGAGFCGYGNHLFQADASTLFGALVTRPITLRPRIGPNQPRLRETRAGYVLDTGQQNPGVKKVIQQYGKHWSRLALPLIAHLPADEVDDLRRTAGALSGLQTQKGGNILAAIELGIPPHPTIQELEYWIEAVKRGSDLPLLVKLPLGTPPELSEAALHAQADALVIGMPPPASAGSALSKSQVQGRLYGPALHSLVLHDLQQLNHLDIPLVAVGGIHSLPDAQRFFEAGASAIQFDSLLFIDPTLAYDIAAKF